MAETQLSEGSAIVDRRVWIARPELPSLAIIIVFVATTFMGMWLSHLTYSHHDLDPVLGLLVWLGAVGYVIRRLRWSRLGGGIQLTGIFIGFAIWAPLCTAVTATTALPYADNWLAAADEWLVPGFHWPAMIATIQPYHRTLLALAYAYTSLTWQPFLLLILFAMKSLEGRAWCFLTAWGFALFVCLIVFPWVPATGAYVHYGIRPEQVPSIYVISAWQYPALLAGLRDGSVNTLGNLTLQGIVAMPSFHAAASILLAWAFYSFRYLRWPFLLLNGGMLLSTVPMGGHYIVDLFAGTAVALCSIATARRIESWQMAVRAGRTDYTPPTAAITKVAAAGSA